MKKAQGYLMIVLVLVLSSCSIFQTTSATSDLTASGVVAAVNINVAPEISGKVTEVDVQEGDSVKAGDVLFKLDCQLLQAQQDQAQAAANTANSALSAANAQVESAQAQYNLTAQSVNQQGTPARLNNWTAKVDSAISLPSWYYQQDEVLAAAQAEVDAATNALSVENSNLQNELKKASNADFVAVEKRLAQAQVAYNVANLTNEQAQKATNNDNLKKVTQDSFDAATTELQAAQSAYAGMLTSSAAQSVLEARARVAGVQARLDNGRDVLTGLQTGTQSLQLQAASAGVKQASSAVEQAQNNLAQANAGLNLIKLQTQKCTVTAAQAGVISARNLESGELIAAGGTVMVISQLNPVNVTVYIPEDRYGQVKLGQQIVGSADSFPNQKFQGKVTYISSEAEFTPRDVQTVSGRKATVYAVKVQMPNENAALKPGMPLDVTFTP